MKAAIREVLEVAGSYDSENINQSTEILRSSVASLCSTLIATPDPPDASPPLYLFRGLSNAVKSYQWPKDTDIPAYLSLSLLNAISATAQESLPYHIRFGKWVIAKLNFDDYCLVIDLQLNTES